MMARFAELAGRIDPARLIGYTFEGKRLRFQLYHEGSSRLYSIGLTTDTVHARSVPTDPVRSRCSITLVDLARRLDVRNDRYHPPTDLALFLKDARDRVTLAYGRRAAESRWLVCLHSEYPLLACLVADLAEIEWEVE